MYIKFFYSNFLSFLPKSALSDSISLYPWKTPNVVSMIFRAVQNLNFQSTHVYGTQCTNKYFFISLQWVSLNLQKPIIHSILRFLLIKRHVFTSHKPEFPDWYCTSLYWFAVLIQCFKTIRHHYTLVWKFSMCCTCINKITLRLHNLHCTYVWNGFEIKVFSNVLDFVICDEPRLHCGHDQWLYVWPGLIVFYLLFCSFSCAYYISTCVFLF